MTITQTTSLLYLEDSFLLLQPFKGEQSVQQRAK